MATTNPELTKEWHPTLNGDLTPWDVTRVSSKRVWWQCTKHESHCWDVQISQRNSGTNCPYCSNKKVLSGFNDLSTTNPELAKEWHPTKNGDKKPSDIICGSTKAVWWQCSKHKEHEWEAIVYSRNNGNRCPYCSNQKILTGYNDLFTTNPEIAKEWHPTLNGRLTPFDVSISSGKKIHWQCSKHKEHCWQTTVCDRKRSNCPYCSNKKVLTGYNDLATTNPGLAKEWHPTKNGDEKPTDFTCGSKKKKWWMCKKGHSWKASIEGRNRGNGCKDCNAEKHTSFPEQAIYFYLKQAVPVEVESRASVFGVELDVYIPSWNIGIEYDGLYFHNSNKSENAENKKNKILFENGVQLIRIKESSKDLSNIQNIIYCVWDGRYNYLNSTLTSLAELLSAMKEIPVCFDVNIDRDGIAIAEQYVISEKHNSLAAHNPILAKEWHPLKNGRLKPEQIAVMSNKKAWWQCNKHTEHVWQAHVGSRSRGVGCPYCCNKKVLQGYNDLATTNPELAKELHPTLNGDLTAKNISAGSGKKAWWQCSIGHEWQAVVAERKKGVGRCSECRKLNKQTEEKR